MLTLSNYQSSEYVIKVNNLIYYIINIFILKQLQSNNKEVWAVRYSVEETPDVRMGQREDGVNNLNRAFVVNKYNYRQQLNSRISYIQKMICKTYFKCSKLKTKEISNFLHYITKIRNRKFGSKNEQRIFVNLPPKDFLSNKNFR
jgi:hypothetical protein